MAPRAVLVEAAAIYARESAVLIEVQSAGGVDVARRVMAGEAVDIVVLASDAIDKLIAAGKLAADSRADLMNSEIAIGLPAGTSHPKVIDERVLETMILEARSLSYSTGPSGRYLEKLFERWGIHDQIRERIIIPSPGVPVAQLIAAGQVALGFQQLSELMNVAGVEVAGSLPASVQHLTTFSAGLRAGCANFSAARKFVQFAVSGALDVMKRQRGMAPAG